MRLYRLIAVLAVLAAVLFTIGAAGAGVVEDAEEELRKLGRSSGPAEQGGANTQPVFPLPGERNIYRDPQPSNSSASRSEGVSAGTNGAASAGSPISVGEGEQGPPKRPPGLVEQESKGRLVSFMVLLVLAVLVMLATAFAKRIESDE